jgi:dolichyl-phosphate beta-glucosyltransferase
LSSCYLSIVIPVYNEEHRLPATLESIFSFLNRQEYPSEVLVVENGSQDNTYTLACSYAERYPGLRIFQELQRGKGLAVRRGMFEAVGEYRFMCDVDFSMPLTEINRFFPPALSGFDIAIASREAPGAKRYNEPFHRHLIGRVFNLLIRSLALPGFHDTQCGFKCFHAPVVEQLFRRQTVSGWTFDVEILYIARRRGYRIVEVPVPWYFNPESKVDVVRDSLQMAIDLLTIRSNTRRGLYTFSDDPQR